MGLIERLRKENEEKERLRRAAEEHARREAEHVAMLKEQSRQHEEEERRQHMERNLRAKRFQEESGITFMVAEMKRLMEGRGWAGDYPDYRLKDIDSVGCFVGWDWHSNYSQRVYGINYAFPQVVSGSGKYFVIETCPDGTIVFHAGWFGSSTIPLKKWQNDKGILEVALERAYNCPKIHSWRYRPSEGSSSDYEGRGPCLPGYVIIDTPNGQTPIKNLKVEDFIWTTNTFNGHKIKSKITQKCRRPVSQDYKIVHFMVSDGRELFASAYHPTIDGKPVISLRKGQLFDGSLVSSITIIPYKGKYTYDILPEGDTGGYWANNILLGSTLFDRFEPVVTGHSISAIRW